MKAVILAGGYGTRISEETDTKPKPLVEVGGYPILWHIMKIYSNYGVNEFIICLGYRGYQIKEYFANYALHMSNVTFDMRAGSIETHSNRSEPWKVTLVDTGVATMTGGRLKRVREFVGDEDFCMTYGDGVAEINIAELIEAHKKNKCLATVTAVVPPSRFGALDIQQERVLGFREKPPSEVGLVSGGFFVLSPKIFDFIDGDHTVWEREPLEALAANGELGIYRLDGFWQPMDTLRDKNHLEALWASGQAPWRRWQ